MTREAQPCPYEAKWNEIMHPVSPVGPQPWNEVVYTHHALERISARLSRRGFGKGWLTPIVRDGLLRDWQYLPEWFRVGSWSKRGRDRYIVFQDWLVVVIAAEKGRYNNRVVKTLVTKECAE